MKKIFILILLLSTILIGCNEISQSRNTNFDNVSEEEEVSVNPNTITNNETTNVEPSEEFTSSEDISSEEEYRELIDTDQEEMPLDDIIVRMRNLLGISKDYDDISTEEYTSNNFKTYSVNYYNTQTNESAWFNSDAYGNLMNFGRYSDNLYNEDGKNESSRIKAEEEVLNLITRLYGEVANEYIITMPSTNYLDSLSYVFDVTRTVNGVKVPNDIINIEISKKDNLPIYINIQTDTNYDFANDSNFESLDNLKTKEEGLEAFKDHNKLYSAILGIDDENSGIYSNYKFQPVYSLFQDQIPINAKTLEPSYYLLSRPFITGEGNMASAEEASGLTPAEQDHLESIESRHTITEAENKARELFDLKDYKLSYSSFSNYNRIRDYNTWNLTFQKDEQRIYIDILANDLSLMSYYIGDYLPDRNLESESSEEDNYVTKGNNFLSTKGGLNTANFTLPERSLNFQNGPTHILQYYKIYEDELHLYNEKVIMTIDKETNEIVNYNREWIYEDDISTPEFQIPEDAVYEILEDQLDFELVYKRNSSSENSDVFLYYELSSQARMYYNEIIVDGTEGKLIDIYGNPISMLTEIKYEDLDEAINPEIIQILAENGIGFSGGYLNPKENITQIDLFRIFVSSDLYGTDPYDLSEDELYEHIINMGILDGEPREPEKVITYRDYSRYVSRILGYSEIASYNNIFKDNYEDIDSDDLDYGYLVLANIKGLIETEENQLTPDEEITRETALYYFYNLKILN